LRACIAKKWFGARRKKQEVTITSRSEKRNEF